MKWIDGLLLLYESSHTKLSDCMLLTLKHVTTDYECMIRMTFVCESALVNTIMIVHEIQAGLTMHVHSLVVHKQIKYDWWKLHIKFR